MAGLGIVASVLAWIGGQVTRVKVEDMVFAVEESTRSKSSLLHRSLFLRRDCTPYLLPFLRSLRLGLGFLLGVRVQENKVTCTPLFGRGRTLNLLPLLRRLRLGLRFLLRFRVQSTRLRFLSDSESRAI